MASSGKIRALAQRLRYVTMTHHIVELRCEHVSATEAGDGFQVLFETTRDSLEGYLLIQRHFEFPDEGKCYLETEAREFCGHFRIRSANLSRTRFQIAFGNASVKRIVVLFTATDSVYAEVKRVLQIMIPKIDIL
jgi:hypothetical protein